jgi:hypothetical protein
MKTLMLLSVLAVAILGSGCAPVAMTRADASGRASCDVQRMAAIERAAERTYTQVYWVSCPLVRPHATG